MLRLTRRDRERLARLALRDMSREAEEAERERLQTAYWAQPDHDLALLVRPMTSSEASRPDRSILLLHEIRPSPALVTSYVTRRHRDGFNRFY